MKLISGQTGISEYILVDPLYLEDLEEIIEILKSYSLTVTISDDKYSFDSLEEAKEYRGKKTSSLTIEASKQGTEDPLIIEFSIAGAHLYTNNTNVFHSALYQIKTLFERQQTWRDTLYKGGWFWFILALSGTFVDPKPRFGDAGKGISILIAIFATLMGVLSTFHNSKKGKIYLVRRHETANYWIEHRDRFIFAIIGGVISGIIIFGIRGCK